MASGHPITVAGARRDLSLRTVGLLLLSVSYGACRWLLHLRGGNGSLPPGVLPYFLCALAFLCASSGSVLVALGGHVRDRVPVSKGWRYVSRPDTTLGVDNELVDDARQ